MALGMEIDGLLPGKDNLYRPLHFNGRQRRNMLGRYVFFSAESAADQLVLHHNPLRIPAQHNGNLMPGIIHALVGRSILLPRLYTETPLRTQVPGTHAR